MIIFKKISIKENKPFYNKLRVKELRLKHLLNQNPNCLAPSFYMIFSLI